MAVLPALGLDCSAYLGKTFVLPQCDADLAILVPIVLALPFCWVVPPPFAPLSVELVLSVLLPLLSLLLLLGVKVFCGLFAGTFLGLFGLSWEHFRPAIMRC